VSFACQPLPGLPEVLLVTPRLLADARGVFFESWHADKFAALGLDAQFVQDNQSNSAPGVLRGLHYQLPPFAQGKLVRVVAGEIFDVAVDIRRSSPTFSRWAARLLSADTNEMLWVPPGFAHGFYVTRGDARVVYKCTAPHSPDHDRVLRWDDPRVAIEWPLAARGLPVLSPKDAAAPGLDTAELFA
jgi:dTDP-4-dehydrorhamnose 3,5-epimerase